MSRTIDLEVNGNLYQLRPSWAASVDVAKLIEDPLTMAIRASRGEDILDSLKTVRLLWIALKHSGESMTESEVGELLFENGIANFIGVASEYLGALVNNGPEKPRKGDTKKD